METSLALETFRYNNEEKWFEIVVKCTHIPSVNSQYQHYGSMTWKADSLVQFENELQDQLVLADPKKHCPWITRDEVYDVHFNFLMNRNFWKRDVSNCVKSTEDILFRSLNVDDSRVLRHFDAKSFFYSDFERVLIRVCKSNFNYNYFNE